MLRHKKCFILTLSVLLILFISTSLGARRKHRRSKGWNDAHPVPYVEVINSTTVLLLKIPTKGSKANCPLVKYTVKVREERTNYVMTRHIQGITDQLTIRYLDPNSNYSIRIIPRDCVGRSWVSNWIFFTTAYPPIPEPARLTKTQAFSNSIFVSWSPPAGDVAVQGYVVGYGEGVPEVNWQYLEGNRTNMTIKNLKKNTQYVVSVRAYNSAGKGPAVYEVVQTKDDAPDMTPPAPSLEAKVMSATSIVLRWTDPSLPPSFKLPNVPEDNRYYSVRYRYRHPQDGKLSEKTEISKKLEMVLTRLNANTEYFISVRTVKDGQAGPYSKAVSQTTLEAVPPQPPRAVSISVSKVDKLNRSVEVLVSWKPPKLTNGNITSYLVQYTNNLELSGDEWTVLTVRGRTEVVITGLVYGGTYYFRVQAKNSQGFGPKTFILKMYALPRNDQAPALLKPVHTVGNKTKRDQSLDSPAEDHLNPQPPHVDFKVMLQVKINGFITWPEKHPSSNCTHEVPVKSYAFRYHKMGEVVWHELELSVNMYVMENLELNSVYEYKVGYSNNDGRIWTKTHQLSTSPDQHEPID